MDIKILEYLIDGSHDINIDEAREQLDALVKGNEQLTARVNGLESWREYDAGIIAKLACDCTDKYNRIATLEQQLDDCEILRKNHLNRVSTLEQQIQQSEKRGYELACSLPPGYSYASYAECGYSYEQACAERDGGEKKE